MEGITGKNIESGDRKRCRGRWCPHCKDDQRIKRIEDSKTTFSGLLRALDEEDLRRRMGDEAELMKLAKDKSKKKLSEVHIYSDGEGDLPLLTPETVLTQED